MALSIDPPSVTAGTAARLGLHFPLLSDPQAQVIRQYRMYNPPAGMAHMGYVLIRCARAGACPGSGPTLRYA